tara:strand:- start:469 stop:657 length:189 start_codon:yes stop_codon:yes gene_type:complete
MKTNFEHLRKRYTTEYIKTIKNLPTDMFPVTAEDIIKVENNPSPVPYRIKNTVRTSIGYITI